MGVISDAEIFRNKGPPIMTFSERLTIAKSCKWVDEVHPEAPYDVTISLLDKVGCHFNAHGDDIPKNPEGIDPSYEVRQASRMKIFKRTEGISTTELVGRLLLMTRNVNSLDFKLLGIF